MAHPEFCSNAWHVAADYERGPFCGTCGTGRPCPDCAVSPGSQHDGGCDVARCTECGWQDLSCEHNAPMELWTGEWPGDVEIAEGLATDHNDLANRHLSGELVWNGTRLVRP